MARANGKRKEERTWENIVVKLQCKDERQGGLLHHILKVFKRPGLIYFPTSFVSIYCMRDPETINIYLPITWSSCTGDTNTTLIPPD